MGLRLLFLSNFPEPTFIQGAKSIPDSRVSADQQKTSFCYLKITKPSRRQMEENHPIW